MTLRTSTVATRSCVSNEQVKNPKSLGIISMKERALILGGEVSIEGIPNKGTAVTVQIPLDDVVK